MSPDTANVVEPPRTSEKPLPHGRIRGNVEAWTVAIVITLMLKLFVIEAFQVPTESMEPTIIGRQPGGDRIIVNKVKYQVSDPERWQVAVFRYPLSRLVNYVKRVVGMPGETLRLARGDVYTRSSPDGEFVIQRKPEGVQDALLHHHPVVFEEAQEGMDAASFRQWWDVPASAGRFDRNEGTLRLEAKGSAAMVAFKTPAKITNERRDPMASTRGGRNDEREATPIGDLRLELEVSPTSGADALIVRMVDGSMSRRPMVLRLAVGSGKSSLAFGEEDLTNEALAGLKLEADETVEVVFQNVDDRIILQVDGDEILSHDYVQPVTDTFSRSSRVSFGVGEGSATFHRVGLYRDLHYTLYTRYPKDTFEVPEGHYLFLGDNSPNSLDARDWRVVGIRLRENGLVLLGDLEAVSDDLSAPRQNDNPWLEPDDSATHHYLDIYGNHFRLEPGSYDVLDLTKAENAQGVGVLALHRTEMKADDPRIALTEVKTMEAARREGFVIQARRSIDEAETPAAKTEARRALAELQKSNTALPPSHAFRGYSVPVHFVPRKDVIGHANLVFFPFGHFGVIR